MKQLLKLFLVAALCLNGWSFQSLSAANETGNAELEAAATQIFSILQSGELTQLESFKISKTEMREMISAWSYRKESERAEALERIDDSKTYQQDYVNMFADFSKELFDKISKRRDILQGAEILSINFDIKQEGEVFGGKVRVSYKNDSGIGSLLIPALYEFNNNWYILNKISLK